MPRLSRPLLLVAISCFALFPGRAPAQAKKDPPKAGEKGDTVRITTVDGVELHAKLYSSAPKNAPTVIILHAIGEDSKKKGYQELAQTLAPNYCVMTFDFRGHGDSKSIEKETFWKYRPNVDGVKAPGGTKAETIEHTQFAKSYYPYMLNDLAAVKGFLDRKNDLGVCNTSNTIIVGAETGATLGAIWINSEWNLYQMQSVMGMFGQQLKPATRSEGTNIIGAVWLSISPTLGTQTVSLSGTLDVAAKQNGTPMYFLYGENDAKGAAVSKALENAIKGTKKNDAKYKYTGIAPIKNSELKGQALIQKSLQTDKAIDAYIKNVVEEKGNEYTERDFRKTVYAWRTPGAAALNPNAYKQAKPMNETNFIFNDYGTFIRR